MILRTIIWLALFIIPVFGIAQEAKFKLYGERTDRKVTLAWIPEVWPDGIVGLIIKRKVNQSDWELLSPHYIIPGSYVGKDLSNVESSQVEQTRLSNKLEEMIINQNAIPVSYEKYLTEILPDTTRYADIAFIFALDYDLILLNGFGFVDRNINHNDEYEYGLFPVTDGQIESNPVASYISKQEDLNDLKIHMNPWVEVIGANKKIRLHWEFDLREYKTRHIKGFNIYRETDGRKEVKLNDQVIWMTSKNNPATLNYLLDFPQKRSTYKAVPVSYFGSEGKSSEIDFNPDSYKIKIQAPKLSCSTSGKAVTLNWDLGHQYNSLINRVEIEKLIEGEPISLKVDSRSRKYVFQEEELGTYYRYRVTIHTISGKKIWSNECVTKTFAEDKVLAPTNLQGEIVKIKDQFYIKLTWDYNGSIEDKEFRIYTNGPGNELIYDSTIPKGVTSPYLIEIIRNNAEKRKFAVLARNAERKNSKLSNEIAILTPTIRLPPISISTILSDKNSIYLEWEFNRALEDVKGFRILVDNKIIISENRLDSGRRSVELNNISVGKHRVEILAVSVFDIESEASPPKLITVK